MEDKEFESFYVVDVKNPAKLLKERRRSMKKKEMEKTIGQLLEDVSDLRNKIDRLGLDMDKLKNKNEILEFTGTFDKDKVEINVADVGFVLTHGGTIPWGRKILCQYIKDNTVVSVDFYLSNDLDKNIKNRQKATIESNTSENTFFKFGKQLFMLDKKKELIIRVPISEKKSEGKKS